MRPYFPIIVRIANVDIFSDKIYQREREREKRKKKKISRWERKMKESISMLKLPDDKRSQFFCCCFLIQVFASNDRLSKQHIYKSDRHAIYLSPDQQK